MGSSEPIYYRFCLWPGQYATVTFTRTPGAGDLAVLLQFIELQYATLYQAEQPSKPLPAAPDLGDSEASE